MSEKKQLQDAIIRILIVVVFAFLYSWGGMEGGPGKWVRRFLAPSILCGGMFYFSRDWRSLICLPLMFGSLSLGYGADMEWLKIIKRGLFGLANGMTTSAGNALNKRWLLVGIQIVLCVGIAIALGVYNPMPDARIEELVIGAIIALFPMMSAQRRSL